ncbi:MAG TPA: MFS transporter [Burkholderiaceae bacterium]|nr:MFS transporter [Burkholderiaceae bacterium]
MTTSPHHLKGAAVFGVFLCFAFAYLMSFGMRAVTAVIAPELMRDFDLSNAQLGFLGSAYFLAFAAMQLPLGVWLDRFGSRRVHGTLLMFSAAGCWLFGNAGSYTELWIGRALIGAGVAGGLMSALKAYRFWYPAERQQSLAAWTLMAGSLGALLVTVPARWAIELLSWRWVFWGGGALFMVAAVVIFVGLPRDEEQNSARGAAGSSLAEQIAGYRQVFRDPFFWRFAMMSLLAHSVSSAMTTLWTGPWLIHVNGFSADRAAQILLLINLSALLGFLGVGAMQPWIRARGWSTQVICACSTAGAIVVQLLISLVDSPAIWPVWLAYAMTATFFSMVQPYVGMAFPASLSGRALTGYNLLVFSGTFGWQWLYGIGIDVYRAQGQTDAGAYRYTMLTAVAVQIIALTVFLIWRPKPPVQRLAASAGKG